MSRIGRPVQRGVGGVAEGIGYFARGLGWVARHPRAWALGLIPALITLVLYILALIWLGTHATDVAEWATPFADDWSAREVLRTLLAIGIFLGGLAVSGITFTAVTLIIGDPFYEKLSENVEEDLGGVAAVARPFWPSLFQSVRDSLVTLFFVLLFSVPLFVLGFVPVIGQTVVPVLGALVSGFFLTVELSSLAMERRGLARKERYALLRANRYVTLGFGVPIFLVFLIPLGAVFAMPGAVAGAAIMVRERLAAPR